MPRSETAFYFQRFGFCDRQILAPVPPNLGLVVVIPCFNELDLIGSLESLWNCERPECSVEVVVIINSAARSNEAIRSRNQRTWEEVSAWTRVRVDSRFHVHLLHFPDLPPKQAGVGLARKIGMDEALRRFDEADHPRGIIACFDADCRCQPNYLSGIERHFQANPLSPGCSIYFEHPLTNEAIAAYELHLRYYVQALRHAGFPYAHHTIGSCMAVRAEVYRQQGGMNKRQAGEDFYFLQKIIPLGHFTDLTATTVFPSPRGSDRVPFGTGKAMLDFATDPQSWTYPFQAFLDLKQFFGCLLQWSTARARLLNSSLALPDSLPASIRSFVTSEIFESAIKEISLNTSTEEAFRKRFFHWFNGFQCMKFLHHARDRFYGRMAVAEEAQKLLRLKDVKNPERLSLPELLNIYRCLDKSGTPGLESFTPPRLARSLD